ncbi:hypothetical protein K461DRAFT_282173 [Myriangium duriaei CBS 260.36]|uniref:Rrn9 domain-containing protein n=1 Tax=Myriangium duriaei CBS 260.36 TaxID=1168546 RepID=A0A9P4IUF6_9PEZI|nr:hypothetical protein K461DRAFT_282173 [Myriangium duriaei CBS 260.36]
MSLFGGDSPHSSESSFSISPIPSELDNDGSPLRNELQNAQQVPLDGEISSPSPGNSDADYNADLDSDVGQEEGVPRDRFPGSDALWKSYAQDEISLAKSLVDLRGDDLAAHLYNTHSWKRSLRNAESFTTAGSFARKSKWIPKDDEDRKPWYPRQTWTTWPLEYPSVPQTSEKLWKNEPQPERTEPLAELSAELTAIALRHLKRNWSERTPEIDERITLSPIRSRSRSRSQSRSRSETPNVQSQSANDAENHDIPELDGPRPVFSADDGRSEAILRPAIMSTVARFDGLLMALHHNRANHFADAEDDLAIRLRSSSLSRSRSASVTKTMLRRRRSSENVMSGLDIDVEGADRPPKRRRTSDDRVTPVDHRGRSRQRSQSVASSISNFSNSDGELDRYRRGVRDWSEVLGLAALTGWDPSIVKRTMDRCTNLFNESMIMSAVPVGAESRPHHSKSMPVPPASRHSSAVNMYFCPHRNCRRHDKGYPLSKGYRFREHLQRAHDYPSDKVRDLEAWAAAPPSRFGPIRLNVRGWIPPNPLSCPYQDCKQASRIYDEPRRLIDHLTRTHKYDPRRDSPPPELRAQATADDVYESDDFMVDGVHNDGFLQPV